MLDDVTLRGWQILHLTGRDHADSVRAGYRDLSVAARIIDFTPAMADVWASADLAISRAGRQQLRRADGLRRAIDPDALPLPQGPAPAV
jgi:hypothetical protein